eukprot:TRINITY_DN5483_c0_g1_i1.p1 TRINITY_DN5483_c0_g1~~TRINITY_DN5483_c0_g1_i1.p1  ORF type:complete len:327 (+),score=59.21 TRINITY_DN5483_c0_g1_i1:143-1123(+)
MTGIQTLFLDSHLGCQTEDVTGSEQPRRKAEGTMYIPEHQVAGHRADGQKPGPLIDKTGRFYKPLQDTQRGHQEVEFYQKFWSNDKICPKVQDFFPRFYGSTFLQASDGEGNHEYAIIEDVTYKFKHPSVIDIKIGSRTWYPGVSKAYMEKCLLKDAETTSLLLGFRISGMQVYNRSRKEIWKADKKWCKSLTPATTQMALKRFVSSNPCSETNWDGCFASSIYDGPGNILSQLLVLKDWFEEQTVFHFNSASLLLCYEGEDDFSGSNGNSENEDSVKHQASVKLIDFAHVIDGNNIIDHNFLGGLCSLIKVIKQIVDADKTSSCH